MTSKSGNGFKSSSQIYAQRLFIAPACISVKIPSEVLYFPGSYGSGFHIRKIELVFVSSSLGQNSLLPRLREFFCVTCFGYCNYFGCARSSTDETNPNNAKVCKRKKKDYKPNAPLIKPSAVLRYNWQWWLSTRHLRPIHSVWHGDWSVRIWDNHRLHVGNVRIGVQL